MPTVFLSLRGDDATRALEGFRRALGEAGQSLVVVLTNDETGYHGSADVSNVAAAREAFSLACKPFPTLRAYLGEAGRDEPAPRPDQQREQRQSRPTERKPQAQLRQSEGRNQQAEGNASQTIQSAGTNADGATPRRSRNRHRNRRRQNDQQSSPPPAEQE